jgi:twinkle protein
MTITAGSGIGKSQVCREIAHNLLNQGETVGYVALEESVRRTSLGIVGIELNKLIHLDIAQVSQDELKVAFDRTIGTGRFFTYDHFGSMDSANLMNRIRFMARGCGCNFIVLDHLSIVVSGIGDGDERRLIDNTMTQLRALVQELNIGMILVSHLKRPDGKGHEEGAATSLSQLRGSAAIAQLSDMVVGLERNQQDPENSNITVGRVLKNRYTGETGIAFALEYNPLTGRLTETGVPSDEEDEEKDENHDF